MYIYELLFTHKYLFIRYLFFLKCVNDSVICIIGVHKHYIFCFSFLWVPGIYVSTHKLWWYLAQKRSGFCIPVHPACTMTLCCYGGVLFSFSICMNQNCWRLASCFYLFNLGLNIWYSLCLGGFCTHWINAKIKFVNENWELFVQRMKRLYLRRRYVVYMH